MHKHLRAAVKQGCKALLAAVSTAERLQCAQSSLGQVALVACELQWCAQVHAALAGAPQRPGSAALARAAGQPGVPARTAEPDTPHAMLAAVHDDLGVFIASIAATLAGGVQPRRRRLLAALLNTTVHQRDVTLELRTARCTSPSAFAWQSQLRCGPACTLPCSCPCGRALCVHTCATLCLCVRAPCMRAAAPSPVLPRLGLSSEPYPHLTDPRADVRLGTPWHICRY
jgi:hypothetical protein